MAAAHEGTFGHRIQQMADDESHPEFTLEMGIGNAMFYVNALPVMTTIVLHWSIYMLQVRHPQHLERIRMDLDKGEMTYFRRCLKEVMRLYHPAVFMARCLKETTVLDGTTMKKRSLVIPWVKLVEQDFAFQPDRWEGNESLFDEVTDDVAGVMYAPFGFRARSCFEAEFPENWKLQKIHHKTNPHNLKSNHEGIFLRFVFLPRPIPYSCPEWPTCDWDLEPENKTSSRAPIAS